MLYDCASEITSDTVVFDDALTTSLAVPGAIFREVAEADKERIFEHKVEPVGEWLLVVDGGIVATGGIATHYNPPYGDLFMEVDEPHRRRGYGSYLIQELKRVPTRRARSRRHAATSRTQHPERRCRRRACFLCPAAERRLGPRMTRSEDRNGRGLDRTF